MVHDTIAAVSTAFGEAAISVIRLSGPEALDVGDMVYRSKKKLSDLPQRTSHLGRLVDENDATLDQALAVSFRAPASYTGEDMVELHCHGGVLVTQRVLERLLKCGARQAEPGEFTQRAFLNGKMDLTQAEAVMDLIHAQSTLAMRAAHEQLEGAIGKEAETMRRELIEVLAHVEAHIDFPDEDIAPETGAALLTRMDSILNRARRLIATSESGRILRTGARTVICGEPNAGKSSLLNALVGFERAIVSPVAGTTRDTIEELIQVHGIPLRLVDTAGLRESEDEIEKSGITRTNRELGRADLIIEVVDAGRAMPDSAQAWIKDIPREKKILVLNKCDLPLHGSWDRSQGIPVSCITQEGIPTLRDAIRDRVLQDASVLSDHPVAINARHKACFEAATLKLGHAMQSLSEQQAPEYVALEIREALQSIGEVTGRVDVEEVLDVIFSSFCIGK
jgi:tRNA modification GTPase